MTCEAWGAAGAWTCLLLTACCAPPDPRHAQQQGAVTEDSAPQVASIDLERQPPDALELAALRASLLAGDGIVSAAERAAREESARELLAVAMTADADETMFAATDAGASLESLAEHRERLVRDLQDVEQRLATTLTEEQRAELEQLRAGIERQIALLDEEIDRHEELLARAEELKALLSRRYQLLEVLGELARDKLYGEVQIEIEHGIVFGDGGIPAHLFRDCLAVLLRDQGVYSTLGTGVLLSPRLVLTARHVADKPGTKAVFTGLDVAQADAQSVHTVAEIRYPPESSPGRPDIAVLVLDTPLTGIDAVVRATPEVCQLACAGLRNVFVAGYGATERLPPGRKRGAVFFAEPEPAWVDAGLTGLDSSTEVVLIDSRLDGKVDTAGGDSGGPAYFLGDDNLYRLGAITSRKVVPKPPTPEGLPGGVYVRVDKHADWLESLMNEYP